MERIALILAGTAIFVVGLLRDRQAVTVTLVILGVAVFVLGVVLPRVQSFSVGPKGIQAELEGIKHEVKAVRERVDALVRVPTIAMKLQMPGPTIEVQDHPHDGTEEEDET